jgi:hypothetical protein
VSMLYIKVADARVLFSHTADPYVLEHGFEFYRRRALQQGRVEINLRDGSKLLMYNINNKCKYSFKKG